MTSWLLRGAVALVGLLPAGAAFAHAVLMDSSPKAGQQLDASPSEVSVTFNEGVGPIFFRVLDRSGTEVGDPGEIRLDGTRMIMPLGATLPNGTYVLTYRVISADTHPVGTTFAFSIGEPVADTSAMTQDAGAGRSGWTWAVAANRWALYGAMLLAAGSALFLMLLGGPTAASAMARRVGRGAAVVAAIAYLLSVGLGGAEMVLGGPGAFFTADAWAKGLASTLTPSAAIGVPAMLLLAWAFGGNGSAPRAGALAVGAAAAIGSFLVTGHAATAPPVWLMATVVGVHLACTAFWFGALPPLLVSATTESPAQAGALMTRFSQFAVWAVAAIFASGVVVSWVQLAGPANLFGNDYGLTLGIKVLLVLAVVGIAAFNRRVLTPALERGDATAAARIRGTIRTEVALFVLILGAAMALTLATPPRALVAQSAASAAGGAFRTTVEAQGYRADIEVSPARAGENMVMATFRDAGGAVLSTVVSVEAVAALESAGISDVRVRAEAMPDGMWHVMLSDMVIPGPWTLDLETFVTDYDKVIFSTTVEIR